jgi:hypothetical protein
VDSGSSSRQTLLGVEGSGDGPLLAKYIPGQAGPINFSDHHFQRGW